MNRTVGITAAVLAIIAVGGAFFAVNNSGAESSEKQMTLAQAAAPSGASATTTEQSATKADEASSLVRGANEAPEVTEVSGHLVKADDSPASNGVIYFVFQNRLNEVPHANPLEKIKAMAEAAVAVDSEGSFTLRMKPGNFAMVYDPASTDAPAEPGPESMTAIKRLSPEQVQARIAAIKENASKGLPIVDGKLGDAFVVENRYIRPPMSNFGDIQLQNDSPVTVKAVDENGELINFPATLRLRGKNGDIMEPHTPSISTRAQYEFHDIMPQSYQVFALGTLPRPGAGDEITTPSIENDQFIYTGDALTHEVVVKPGDGKVDQAPPPMPKQ